MAFTEEEKKKWWESRRKPSQQAKEDVEDSSAVQQQGSKLATSDVDKWWESRRAKYSKPKEVEPKQPQQAAEKPDELLELDENLSKTREELAKTKESRGLVDRVKSKFGVKLDSETKLQDEIKRMEDEKSKLLGDAKRAEVVGAQPGSVEMEGDLYYKMSLGVEEQIAEANKKLEDNLKIQNELKKLQLVKRVPGSVMSKEQTEFYKNTTPAERAELLKGESKLAEDLQKQYYGEDASKYRSSKDFLMALEQDAKELQSSIQTMREFQGDIETNKGVLKGIQKGMNIENAPVFGSVVSVLDAAETNKIMKKLEAGDKLSESDRSKLISVYGNEYVGKNIDRGTGYRIGEGVPASLALMAEVFLAGGTTSAAKTGTKKVVTKAITKEVSEEGLESLAKMGVRESLEVGKKEAVAKVVSNLAAEAAGAAVVTGTTRSGAVFKSYEEFKNPEYDLFASEEGELILEKLNEGDNEFKALTKAIALNVGENLIESGGGALVDKPIEAVQKKILGEFMAKKGIKSMKELNTLLSKAGVNGFAGEVFEEELQYALNEETEGRSYQFDIDRLIETTMAVSVLQGGMRAVSTVGGTLGKEGQEARREAALQDGVINDVSSPTVLDGGQVQIEEQPVENLVEDNRVSIDAVETVDSVESFSRATPKTASVYVRENNEFVRAVKADDVEIAKGVETSLVQDQESGGWDVIHKKTGISLGQAESINGAVNKARQQIAQVGADKIDQVLYNASGGVMTPQYAQVNKPTSTETPAAPTPPITPSETVTAPTPPTKSSADVAPPITPSETVVAPTPPATAPKRYATRQAAITASGLKKGDIIVVGGKERTVKGFGTSISDPNGVSVEFVRGTPRTLETVTKAAQSKSTVKVKEKQQKERETEKADMERKEKREKGEFVGDATRKDIAKRRLQIGKKNPRVQKINEEIKALKSEARFKNLSSKYKETVKNAFLARKTVDAYIEDQIDRYGDEASGYYDNLLGRYKAAQSYIEALNDLKRYEIDSELKEKGLIEDILPMSVDEATRAIYLNEYKREEEYYPDDVLEDHYEESVAIDLADMQGELKEVSLVVEMRKYDNYDDFYDAVWVNVDNMRESAFDGGKVENQSKLIELLRQLGDLMYVDNKGTLHPDYQFIHDNGGNDEDVMRAMFNKYKVQPNAKMRHKYVEDTGRSRVSKKVQKEIQKLSEKWFGDNNVLFQSEILTPSGNQALGMYYKKWIHILNGQSNPSDTFAHEAVHKALDVYNHPVKRKAILNEVIAKYGEEKLKEKWGGYGFSAENKYLYAGPQATDFNAAVLQARVFLGKYDKKQRFELDDSEMRYMPAVEGNRLNGKEVWTAPLGEVIKYDTLFHNYPALKDIPISTVKNLPTLGVFETLPDGSFGISIRAGLGHLEESKVLLHEIQHFIQTVEGFAIGDSISGIRSRDSQNALERARLESYKNAWEFALDAAGKTSDFNGITDKAFTKTYEEWVSDGKWQFSKGVFNDSGVDRFLKQSKNFSYSKSSLMSQINNQIAKIELTLDSIPQNPDMDAVAQYLASAGEIESRDIEARMAYSKGQRDKIAPYSSSEYNDAIVRFGKQLESAKDLKFNTGETANTIFDMAEEQLAEDFIAYVNGKKTFKGQVKQFFDDLIEFIRNLVGNGSEISKFYKELYSGRFANRLDGYENGLKPSFRASTLADLMANKEPIKEAGVKDGRVYEAKSSIQTYKKAQTGIAQELDTAPRIVSTPESRFEASKKPISGKGKLKTSRAFSRVMDRYEEWAEEHEDEFNALGINYRAVNLTEDVARAIQFVTENPKAAKRVALGLDLAPDGILASNITMAFSEVALENGSVRDSVLAEVAMSNRLTRAGQEIVALRGRVNQNSPSAFINRVLQIRRENIKGTYGIDWRTLHETGKRTKTKTEYQKKLASKISEGKKAIKTADLDALKIQKAQDFLDKLVCR